MEISPATQCAQRLSRKLAGAIFDAPRTALCCFSAAAVLLGSHFIWSAVHGEPPPAIVPPAGEVMEGTVPFHFAVISDTRGNQAVFEDALGKIKNDRPNLLLHAGDIAQRYKPRQFDWVLHELDEENLTVPFCPVPGNHDIDRTTRDVRDRYRLYNRAFGPRRYWFSYANSLFVAFDDSTERCGADDLRWLRSTLEKLRDKYELCFVYMHMPPRDPRPGKNHALREEDGEKLMSLLKEYDVSAVFAGHLHSYAEDNIKGIPIYITGGAGESKKIDEPHHYLLCTVGPDGSFAVRRRDIAHQIDTDHPEYVFLVKFPSNAVLLGGIGLLFAGLVFSSRSIARGRDGTRRS